jgi:hypothetical protein
MYEVRFVLPAGGINEVNHKSVPFEIRIAKPVGIDEEALRQLRKNQKNSAAPDELFRWKENAFDSGRYDLLEDFVDKYQLSVYGDYAVLHLANFYLARGNVDSAKGMLDRASASRNEFVRNMAKKGLDEVAAKKDIADQIDCKGGQNLWLQIERRGSLSYIQYSLIKRSDRGPFVSYRNKISQSNKGLAR